jgi:hypothetical protein
MKIKKASLSFILAISFLAVTSRLSAADGTQIGRFQLVTATVYDEMTKTDVKMLFRIDTQTGTTWVWSTLPIAKTTDGKQLYANGWVEVEENLAVDAANTIQNGIRKDK